MTDERKPDFESEGVHDVDLNDVPTEIGILPLRDTLLFPQAILPLAVARESSVALVNDAVKERKVIGVVTQRDPSVDDPAENDLFGVGTLTHIHKMFRFPDGSLRLVVQGIQRFRIRQVTQYRPFLKAQVELIREEIPAEQEIEVRALAQSALGFFQRVVELSPTLSDELANLAANIQEPKHLADFVAGNLPTLNTAQKQEFLETLDVHARLERVNKVLVKDLEVLEVGSKIQSQVKSELQKNQREYYLREQMKAIQKELGDNDDQQRETSELREKIEAAGMPEEAKKEALRELERLSRMSPAAAEYTVTRTYLDWVVSLPWNKRSEGEIDLVKAKQVLDNDHYDLEKVKDRILEYLAVRKMKPDLKGPILCFVGPPGVGKTSLGKSIASAPGAQVPPPEPGRHARRGGDPRAPPHLHRRPARADHPGPAARREQEPGHHPRRGRQDRRRLPRRPLLGAAGGARPRAEQQLQGPLHRPALRPLGGAVHHHRQHPRHRAARPAGPHGGDPAGRLHRGGQAPHRPPPHPAEAAREPRAHRGARWRSATSRWSS